MESDINQAEAAVRAGMYWRGLWRALGSPAILDLTGGREQMLADLPGAGTGMTAEGIGLLVLADTAKLDAHPELAGRLSESGAVLSLSGPLPALPILADWKLDWAFPLALAGGGWIGGRDPSHRKAVATEIAEGVIEVPPVESLRSLVEAYERVLDGMKHSLEASSSRTMQSEFDLAKSEQRFEAFGVRLVKEKHSTQFALRRSQQLQHDLHRVLSSKSWRITEPLRRLSSGLNWVRGRVGRLRSLTLAFFREANANGLVSSIKRTQRFLSGSPAVVVVAPAGSVMTLAPPQRGEAPRRPNGLPPAAPASQRLVQRVLIIAELGLQQCLKYRVLQKRMLIQSLGVECTVVNWTDVESARSLLQTHSIAIFYRVPGWPTQLETVRIAKSMGVVTLWEVDDLIFDLEAYLTNSNLDDLDHPTRQGVLNGVPLYQKMMLECDECITSTPALAASMRKTGVRQVHVVRNALDKETIRIAEQIRSLPKRRDGLIRIVYGSGSRSHDSDFRTAAAGLRRVLKARYDVRLVIIGTLNLPPEFEDVIGQVERLPLVDYETYMERFAMADISIAPLEQSVFNDGKSNIKYLEAAVLGIPSVCSPSEEFRLTIESGKNGFLAQSQDEWEEFLLALVNDPALRESVGVAAREHVMSHFTPEAIAADNVKPFLNSHKGLEPTGLRVLGANIFFEPRSFGGATIVAEQIARRMNEAGGVTYAMLTSAQTEDVQRYKIVRYESSHCEVFAMGLPPEENPVLDYDNPYPRGEFRNILNAWRPDVVHLHSIQGFGIQLAEACVERGIPFVVTLHDAWWICARQFMVTGEGRYCNQKKISLDVCARCVVDPARLPHRNARLREVLEKAALLLVPSEFFRDIYEANGFDPERIVINKNGIAAPRRSIPRTPPSGRKLRFGFVGGEGAMKGGDLIKKAFRSLAREDYELLVVDNALNLGWKSIHAEQWVVPGKTRIVPAYTQETIDEFFSEIDVLLFPSQCKESFGLAAREALVRNVWLISTDAGGVVEDIVDGVNGTIIPFDDDGTELARRIDELLQNPARLDGYENPAARNICLFEQQARELREHMSRVALRHDGKASSGFVSEVEFYENLMSQM